MDKEKVSPPRAARGGETFSLSIQVLLSFATTEHLVFGGETFYCAYLLNKRIIIQYFS